MATPENTFIQSVHRHLPERIYRMKNHNQYNGGIPDVWYSGPAGDLWIEYKFVVLPKRENTIITLSLSDLQKDWLKKRSAEGRKLGVIVGAKEGGVWCPDLAWVTPITAKEFKSTLLTRQQLAEVILGLIT